MEPFRVEVSGNVELVGDDPDVTSFEATNTGLIVLVYADDAMDAAQKVIDVIDDYDFDRVISVWDGWMEQFFAEDPGTGEAVFLAEEEA